MGGISIWQLLIVAVIVVLLFGTKKLRGLGGDLGSAIKGFKKAVSEDEKPVESITEKKQLSQLLTVKKQQKKERSGVIHV